jgi:hypothetical protein
MRRRLLSLLTAWLQLGVCSLTFIGCEAKTREYASQNSLRPPRDGGNGSVEDAEGGGGEALAPPALNGERSAGHFDLTWLWGPVPGASRYEVRLSEDDAWVSVLETRYSQRVDAAGVYTLQARACDASACSQVATFTTEVESFGASDGPWRGVARSIAQSPLGRHVGIRCSHCFQPEAPTDAGMASGDKLRRAVARGADVVEVDVALLGEQLCVTSDAAFATCSPGSTLEALAEDPSVADADVLIWLTVTETTEPPDSFATRLLQTLSNLTPIVKNGRPLFVQVDHTRLDYVRELAQQSRSLPFLRPYLRFGVSYAVDAFADVAIFQDAIRSDAADSVVEWVQLDRRTPNLRALSLFAESLTNVEDQRLAIMLADIPVDYGAQHVTALREFADSLSAEYRVDQAKSALIEPNVLAHVDSSRCASPADTTVDILRNTSVLAREALRLDESTPTLVYSAEGGDQFGCTFDFRANPTEARALNLGVTTPKPRDGGYLVTASVNFDDLALEDGDNQDIVANSEAAGFYLALAGQEQGTFLRFGVHVAGTYHLHEYNVASTGLGGALEVLNGTDTYQLMGSYAPGEGVRLWVDGQSVGESPPLEDAVKLSAEPALVGADPGPLPDADGTLVETPRFFLKAFMQNVSIVSWRQAPSGDSN